MLHSTSCSALPKMELSAEKRDAENTSNDDNPQAASDSADGNSREAEEQRERQAGELKTGLHPLKVRTLLSPPLVLTCFSASTCPRARINQR